MIPPHRARSKREDRTASLGWPHSRHHQPRGTINPSHPATPGNYRLEGTGPRSTDRGWDCVGPGIVHRFPDHCPACFPDRCHEPLPRPLHHPAPRSRNTDGRGVVPGLVGSRTSGVPVWILPTSRTAGFPVCDSSPARDRSAFQPDGSAVFTTFTTGGLLPSRAPAWRLRHCGMGYPPWQAAHVHPPFARRWIVGKRPSSVPGRPPWVEPRVKVTDDPVGDRSSKRVPLQSTSANETRLQWMRSRQGIFPLDVPLPLSG